jgi:hypothetical protein
MNYPGPHFTTIGGRIRGPVTGPTTERLLIIGTALDGPINRPIRVDDALVAERLFGPANYSQGYLDPNTSTESGKDAGASIPTAIQQALAAGCTDIYVVRATGTYARSASAFDSKLDIRSLSPGRIYNNITVTSTVAASGIRLTVAQPTIKGGTFYSDFASSMTISEMIDELNNDRRNKTLFILRSAYPAYLNSAVTALGSGTATLTGGTNGCRARGDDYGPETGVNGYATLLTNEDSGTFDVLLGMKFRFNVCVLSNIYIDDQVVDGGSATSTTIAYDYSLWLDNMSSVVNPCFGVIGVRPPNIQDEATLISYITGSLLATSPGAWDSTQRWNKAGPFIYNAPVRNDPVAGTIEYFTRLAVVGGPEVVLSHPDLGRYTDMWHILYAAYLTTISPERAPIFKQLPGIVAYGTAIPGKYADRLLDGVGFDSTDTSSVGKGAYVILTRNPRDPLGPMVIYEDCTAASRDNYFRDYQILHLCNNIHSQLDDALAGFLGGPTNQATMSAMETKIQNVMDGYVFSGALKGNRGQGYEFRITQTGTDAILGAVRIWIELSPATALRKIYFTVSVRQIA